MKRLLVLLVCLVFLAVPATAGTANCVVDVNTATAKQLTKLKGIGPALAGRIIAYRKAKRTEATKKGKKTWNFRNWKGLMAVKGVSKSLCAQNISKLCFSGKLQKACPK